MMAKAPQRVPPPSQADDIQAAKERELFARVRNIRSKNSVAENLKVWGEDSSGKIQDCRSPGKIYEWINSDHRRVSYFESREYVVCNASNSPNIMTNWKRDDGTHVQGDAILMMVDRDLKEELDKDDALRSLERDRLAPGGYDPETAAWARANNVTMAPLSAE
jgi:hypothetical protein